MEFGMLEVQVPLSRKRSGPFTTTWANPGKQAREAKEAGSVVIDNQFYPKYPYGVNIIGTIVISKGVLLLIYPKHTWDSVGGGLLIAIAIGLLSYKQWARVAIIAFSMLDVGLYGMALTRLRHLRSLGSLIVFLLFLLYASILGYLLMPRIGRLFARPVPDLAPLAAEK
jgi:hypothetical protein